MSFVLSFTTDHRLSLLQFVNSLNPNTIIQNLTLENTLLAEPGPEVDGKYSVELTNKADDTDRVTVTHLKHKLEEFISLVQDDIDWYDPTMSIDELRPHAEKLFTDMLLRAGIVPEKGFGNTDLGSVDVMQDDEGSFFLLFEPKSHVWEDMFFPMPPTFDVYSKVKDLSGFEPFDPPKIG